MRDAVFLDRLLKKGFIEDDEELVRAKEIRVETAKLLCNDLDRKDDKLASMIILYEET